MKRFRILGMNTHRRRPGVRDSFSRDYMHIRSQSSGPLTEKNSGRHWKWLVLQKIVATTRFNGIISIDENSAFLLDEGIVPTIRRMPSRTPFHKVLALLQDHISTGDFGPSARLPSGRELAQKLDLDFSTLNRAIRELVMRGVLRREGYKLYVPRNPEAFQNRTPIHIVSPHAKFIAGASETAALYGTRVIPHDWHWRAYRNQVRSLLDEGCEALLVRIARRTSVDDLLERFSLRNIPVVAVGHGHGLWNGSSVEMDGGAAARIAVAHLAELSHHEIACFSLPGEDPLMLEGYQRACREYGMASSATRILCPALSVAEMSAASNELRIDHPEVTGVFITDTVLAKYFIEETKQHRAIPQDLSVVAYGDAEYAAHLEPPLTTVEDDHRRLGKYAAYIVLEQRVEVDRLSALPRPDRLLIEPLLIRRMSTALPRRGKVARKLPVRPAGELLATEEVEKWKKRIQKRLTTPYPAVRNISPNRFCPLDLRSFANRGVHRFKSWLGGAPLLHVAAGRQTIHGVPFDIIDEATNQERAVVVMHSRHAKDHALPAELDIPIRKAVSHIYILHGCGWAGDHVKSAVYEFMYEDGHTANVDLVPYGYGPVDEVLKTEWRNESNIQDWWPNFTQFDNKQARHVTLTKEGDPEAYERYLYTLEWENRRLDKKIRKFRIRVNPRASFTLGVLAVTIVLCPGK